MFHVARRIPFPAGDRSTFPDAKADRAIRRCLETVQRIVVNLERSGRLESARISDAEGAEADRTLRGHLGGQGDALVQALSSFRLQLPG